jgi:hypothetical protein
MHPWVALGGIAIAGVVGAAVMMAEPSSRSYPVPIDVARERLAAAPVPAMLLGVAGRTATLVRTGNILIWHLGDRGSSGRVTAELSADGQATRVRLATDIKPDPLGGALTASRLYADMADDIFAEYVESAILGRAFDPVKFGQRTAARLQADPSLLAEFGEGISARQQEVSDIITQDDTFNRDAGGLEAALADLEDQANAAKAYEATRSARKNSTRPTTDLVGY